MGFFRVAYVALSAAGGGGNGTVTGSATASGTPRFNVAVQQSTVTQPRAGSVAYFRVADVTVTQPAAVFFRVAGVTVSALRPPSYFRVAGVTLSQPAIVRFRVADVTVVAPSQSFVWDGKKWVSSLNVPVGNGVTATGSASGVARFTVGVSHSTTVTVTSGGLADGPGFAHQATLLQSSVSATVSFLAAAQPQATFVDATAGGVFTPAPDVPPGGDPSPTPPPVDGGVLYSPPQQVDQFTLVGSIVYKMNVSTTTWKDAAGVWRNTRTPSSDDLLGASYVFDRPTVVSPDLAAELSAAGMVTEATT